MARRFFLLLLCACWLRVSTGQAGAAEPQAKPARFITIPQLRAAVDGHKGRVLVVHFWASWCEPCMRELASVAKLAREYGARGVDFLPISLDEPTQESALWVGRVLSKKTGDPAWSPILKWDESESLVGQFDPRWDGEIPVFFVYDREAHLRRTFLGSLGRGDFERLLGDLVPQAGK